MKRLIPLILAVFLLVGCSPQVKPPQEKQEPASSEIRSAYIANSFAEQQSDGAVRLYALSGDVNKLEIMESGLILLNEQGKMALISGTESVLTAFNDTDMQVLSVAAQEIIGYTPESRTVTVLDQSLNSKAQFTLEEGISGEPIAGTDTREVYYCADGYIRAFSLETGLTRNVMQYVQGSQQLIGCYFGGELLGWDNDDGKVFLSSEDGMVSFNDPGLSTFETSINSYYAVYMDGIVEQRIWGTIDTEAMQLQVDEGCELYPQLYANCLISVTSSEDKLSIHRYDMNTGMCTGKISSGISGAVIDIVTDNTYTWILTDEGLYRWEHALTPDKKDVFVMTPLVTADNPDVEGIKACAQRAQQIGVSYGVSVYVWKDALLNDDSYVIEPEHQIEIITSMLDQLEAQLGEIPESILKGTEEYCGIQICLVRSIESQDFIQFWSDGGLCIVITPTANMQEALLTGLGWGIDSCVIGNSRDLDYWNDLNPSDFIYDYNYFVNEQRTDLQYLEGENRAFADKRAMAFPSEDRARVFYYAMLPDNEELFASKTLQAKLRIFCEGIREAYGWQRDTQSFPWEQYLEKSLAYTG